jgi:hypothetical protein
MSDIGVDPAQVGGDKTVTFEIESPWITTFTGRQFHPFNPAVSDIHIYDIAHALANTCRFNGHTNQFYSVAQHSVLVAEVVKRMAPDRPCHDALLHDAAEAYLTDVCTPVKRSLDGFVAMEERVLRTIFEAYKVDRPGAVREALIHRADTTLLATEARDLVRGWKPDGIEPLAERIVPWSPERAEVIFLRAFRGTPYGEWRIPAAM